MRLYFNEVQRRGGPDPPVVILISFERKGGPPGRFSISFGFALISRRPYVDRIPTHAKGNAKGVRLTALWPLRLVDFGYPPRHTPARRVRRPTTVLGTLASMDGASSLRRRLVVIQSPLPYEQSTQQHVRVALGLLS